MRKFHQLPMWVLLAVLLVSIAPSMAQDTTETDCEAGFRLFDHEMLASDPVCIPENPQRILALEISAVETVLFTDKELVGTANWLHEEIPVLMPELAPALESIADTGYPANLEVALLTEPDLILAVDGDIDLEAGSEIAPIVMPVAGLEYDWRLSMEFWSAVLGTEDLYADMLANYDARIAEFKDALDGEENLEISIVGTSSYGAYLWLVDTAPSVVVADAGLARPESQALNLEESIERYGTERWILISEETFDLADGDGVFVFTYATTDPETLETESAAMEDFKANPIWNALSATKAGNVYYVGPYWWRAQTYLLANKVLDDLFTHLTDTTATTPVLSASTTTVLECEVDFRAVTDAAGTAMCVPEAPQRVISLTDGDTDSLVALGIDPVGVSNGRGSQTPPRYLIDLLSEESISVGAFYQPNLEIVLGLEPDLILFSYGDYAEPEMIEQLRAIAPVYFTAAGEDTWRDLFYGVGDALNLSDDVEAFFEELDTRIATVGESIEPETEFIIARWSAEGPQVMAPYIFAPSILQQAGMVMPEEIPDLQAGHAHSAPLSLETVDILDVDWAFVGTLQAEGEAVEALEAVFENPLFQQLAVVQNEHVIVIDGSIWTSSGGPIAANLVLDVVEENLGGTMTESETSPNASCEAGLRALVDSMGTAHCLPENPERIVTLADGDTDALITLGVDPVGISNGRGSQTPPRYLLDYLPEDYVSVGTFFQPNMETVLSLEPDLILFSSGQHAEPEMLEQLNAIAPVFVPSTESGAWQEPFVDIGKALNMEAEVDAYIAEYNSNVAAISATIEPETQFIIARWSAEGPQIMGPHIFAPAILQELGLVMPAEIPDYQAGHPHSAPLSLEALEFLEADWAFIGTLQAEGDAAEALEAVFENPLFQQLAVVQNDHVVVIDGSVWTSSGGPFAANLILDVVQANIGGE